jgi:uncharacterized protein YidB (DUF937 family)
MGLFDQIVSGALRSALGQGSGDATSSVLPGLLGQLLGQTNLGSIGGLLSQLQQGGLGNEVASWLGNGANRAVSPDQLRSALGGEQVEQMASSAGLPIDQLLSMLSQHLPGAVDRASPHGALDDSQFSSSSEEPAQDDQADSRESGQGSLADDAGLNDIGRA